MTVLEDPLRGARRAVQDGRFREAWESLASLPAVTRQEPEWLLLAAMAQWRLGWYAASRETALQAGDGYRRAGDPDGEMRAENVAAAGAFALGRLAEAEAGFLRAGALAERLDDELMRARSANNLGNIAYYRCEDMKALSFYRLAETRFERAGLRHGVAETMINTGIVWRDLDLIGESLDAAERAFELASRIGSHRLAAEALSMRGEALALLGDEPLGRAQAQRALQMAREQEDRIAEIDALRVLSHLERDRDRFLAEQRAREAVALARSLGQPWAIAESERDLGVLQQRMGRGADAALCFEAAAAAFQSLGASKRSSQMLERAEAARA